MAERIYLSAPHMGGQELAFIQEAFDSNFIAPIGPMIERFEREFSAYTQIPHCVALSSGTAALHLALRCLGVGSGDPVIASSLTFIGSVSPITFLHAEPILVDSESDSWNMDPTLLTEAIDQLIAEGRPPKAVLPTDIYGQCNNYERLQAICEPHGIPLLVDAAEAVGATWRGRHAGRDATAAAFSFNGNKIITTSGGGMLASHDEAMIAHARKLATQSRDPAPHYQHSEIGYNYRMSNIVAAIGCGQLQVLDEHVDRRRAIFETYRRELGDCPGVSFMPEPPDCRSTRWLSVMLLEPGTARRTPDELRQILEARNIEARPVWKPMHLQPVFEGVRMHGGAFCERLFATGLCLPSGSAMTATDLDRVITCLHAELTA